MTQTITKNIVAVAFVAALFSILLAMPQASEAKSNVSDLHFSIKSRAMASSTATSSRGEMGERFKGKVASSTASSTRPSADISCVQTAVQEREIAIIASWGEFNTSITVALTARKDALVDAWQLTDTKDRAEALKALWKNWKDASKKAHGALKTDRKAAWGEFKKTMKEECREARLPKEDAEQKDAAGAVTL